VVGGAAAAAAAVEVAVVETLARFLGGRPRFLGTAAEGGGGGEDGKTVAEDVDGGTSGS
jgi:hypothetical protein